MEQMRGGRVSRGILSPCLEWTYWTNGDMEEIKAKPTNIYSSISRFFSKYFIYKLLKINNVLNFVQHSEF